MSNARRMPDAMPTRQSTNERTYGRTHERPACASINPSAWQTRARRTPIHLTEVCAYGATPAARGVAALREATA